MNTNLNEAKASPPACPFCGRRPSDDNDPVARRVSCQTGGCPLEDIGFHPDQWNTRAPQPKPTGTEALVCEDIAARQAVGLKKYGVSVADNPLTKAEWRNHLYQELLDAVIYLKREMQEEDAPPITPTKSDDLRRLEHQQHFLKP